MLIKWINKINELAGAAAAFLCLFLIILTVQQVIARYCFNAHSNGLEELKWHLFGMIFLLSLGYTYQHGGHVRVDVFYQKWTDKTKAWINFGGQIVIVQPLCLLMIYFGTHFSISAYQYINPKELDHFTNIFFSDKNGLYYFSASIESFLRNTILRGEISDVPKGLEARWVIKAFIPLGFALLLIQSLALSLKELRILQRGLR